MVRIDVFFSGHELRDFNLKFNMTSNELTAFLDMLPKVDFGDGIEEPYIPSKFCGLRITGPFEFLWQDEAGEWVEGENSLGHRGLGGDWYRIRIDESGNRIEVPIDQAGLGDFIQFTGPLRWPSDWRPPTEWRDSILSEINSSGSGSAPSSGPSSLRELLVANDIAGQVSIRSLGQEHRLEPPFKVSQLIAKLSESATSGEGGGPSGIALDDPFLAEGPCEQNVEWVFPGALTFDPTTGPLPPSASLHIDLFPDAKIEFINKAFEVRPRPEIRDLLGSPADDIPSALLEFLIDEGRRNLKAILGIPGLCAFVPEYREANPTICELAADD